MTTQMTAIVDKLLSQASSMYMPDGFVCEQILPTVQVMQTTGKLAKYGTSHLRIEASIGGGRGAYRRVDSVTRSTSSYSIDSFGLEDIVTARDLANVEIPYNAFEDVGMALTNLLYLRKEKGLADTLTSTSIITQNTTLSGTSQYSDQTGSTPVQDFVVARKAVRDGCGMPPNCAIMDWATAEYLSSHGQLLELLGYKYNRPDGLTYDELAKVMKVEKLLIAKCKYESAKEGQTSSLANVWGKDIVFCYAPSSAQLRQTSVGYQVQLAGQPVRQVYKYPINNPPRTTAVLVEDSYDMFISNAAAAYVVKAAIA